MQIDMASYQKTILFFEKLIQLLHPFMPFITEELYHLLRDRKDGDDICIFQYPGIKNVPSPDKTILQQAEFLKAMITEIRNVKTRLALKKFTIYVSDRMHLNLSEIIQKNTKATAVEFAEKPADGMITAVIGGEKVFIETEKTIDNDYQRNELTRELEYHKGFLDSVNKKLENDRFIKNAKPEIIALEQKKKADAEAKIRTLEESLSRL